MVPSRGDSIFWFWTSVVYCRKRLWTTHFYNDIRQSSSNSRLRYPHWTAQICHLEHSDREGERCNHITFSLLRVFGIAGFMLAMSTMNKMIRYCSLWVFSRFPDSFLKSHNSRFYMAKSNGGVICLLAWASASVSHPPEKRDAALALINCVGQFGNILGSYVFSALSTFQDSIF